jgi:hypothetical protein
LELLLEVISGRRKLIEKHHRLDGELRAVRVDGREFPGQINSEHRVARYKTANQAQETIGQVSAFAPAETAQNQPPHHDWRFGESFVGIQSGPLFCEPLQMSSPSNRKDCI